MHVLDHLVVGGTNIVSLAEMGLLSAPPPPEMAQKVASPARRETKSSKQKASVAK